MYIRIAYALIFFCFVLWVKGLMRRKNNNWFLSLPRSWDPEIRGGGGGGSGGGGSNRSTEAVVQVQI